MTELSMIHRVARAIAAVHAPAENPTASEGWQDWIDAAIAAVSALREPTKDMLAAADIRNCSLPWWFETQFEQSWGLAIDAAISATVPSHAGGAEVSPTARK
jgi:hypothetical protein